MVTLPTKVHVSTVGGLPFWNRCRYRTCPLLPHWEEVEEKVRRSRRIGDPVLLRGEKTSEPEIDTKETESSTKPSNGRVKGILTVYGM